MISKRSYDSVEWIYEGDSAIDRDSKKFDHDKFEETLDLKYVPLRKDCKPTVFVVRQLSRKQFINVTSQDGVSSMMDEAIRYGLVSVKNFELDGKKVSVKREKTDLGEAVTEESLDQLHSPKVSGSLGAFIVRLSRLDPLASEA